MKRDIPQFLLFLVLSVLLLASGLLRILFPNQFFPMVPLTGVIGSAVFGSVLFGMVAFRRWYFLFQKRKKALLLIKEIISGRKAANQPLENDLANAERTISRLVRNADEDLKEINPDFKEDSLPRLSSQIPILLDEIGNREDALIRLGVLGTYLGETACRSFKWAWKFQYDPLLGRFAFLASVLGKGERVLDPYALGADILTGSIKTRDLQKELK